MPPPNRVSDLLVELEACRVCRLLPMSEFVSFCNARNINVSFERLRKLEQLKLFYPVLRIYRQDVLVKVEYVDGGARYRDLGHIEEGEIWTGDTLTELAGFDFSARVIKSWREHGSAWDPSVDNSPHTETIDTDGRRNEAYYSQFQIDDLATLVAQFTVTVATEWAIENDGSSSLTSGDQLKCNLANAAEEMYEYRKPRTGDILATLCQVISDRYYPKTQTDERHITLSSGGPFWDWDWYEYARAWDAPAVAKLFQLEKPTLKRLYQRVASTYQHIDPMAKWQRLVRFISVQKRQQLKGDALHAQTMGEMAKMLQLFYHDAFEEAIEAPGDLGRTIIHPIPDVAVEDDPMRALELIVNDFGINPKPQAVLFVEGATESTVIPLVFDWMFAASHNVFGIELINLRGVSNATGGKDHLYSALWRLIDYLHHHQTVSFVLLDNEGLAASNVAAGLPRAASIHFPDRLATRKNYIKLWKLSFEFDNFNDVELAQALTAYADGKVKFAAPEVKLCRDSAKKPMKNKKLRTLDVLYQERTGLNLNKPLFGKALVELMLLPRAKRKPANRPIVRFLDKMAKVAAMNHQPTTRSMWEYNQRTGYLGTLRPGAAAKRKNPFSGTRKKRPASQKQ